MFLNVVRKNRSGFTLRTAVNLADARDLARLPGLLSQSDESWTEAVALSDVAEEGEGWWG